MIERHTLIITVANRIGVLARISGLLSSRGFNVENIIGCRTENPDIYRIQIVVEGTREQIEQLSKQIQKLIDTLKVVSFPHKKEAAIYEFVLAKVPTRGGRGEILDLVKVFGAEVVDISPAFMTIEVSGPSRKIDRFLELIKPFGLREYLRSGEITIG